MITKRFYIGLISKQIVVISTFSNSKRKKFVGLFKIDNVNITSVITTTLLQILFYLSMFHLLMVKKKSKKLLN